MNCPMYKDFTRGCIQKMGYIPGDTLQFCQSDLHEECPFYKVIKSVGVNCEYIMQCPVYKEKSMGDFDSFREMTKEYCLAEFQRCKRYQIRSGGGSPAHNLMPDGSFS